MWSLPRLGDMLLRHEVAFAYQCTCAGPMLLACIGNSLWQLVLEMSMFACQKPVLL